MSKRGEVHQRRGTTQALGFCTEQVRSGAYEYSCEFACFPFCSNLNPQETTSPLPSLSQGSFLKNSFNELSPVTALVHQAALAKPCFGGNLVLDTLHSVLEAISCQRVQGVFRLS